MASRRSETGNSTLSNIFWLAVLAAFAYACWNVVPVYYEHYTLQDKMIEMARLPKYNNNDEQIKAKLMRQVREMRMENFIYPQNIKIVTRENSRTISVEYMRTANVLPGYKHTFAKAIVADQPIY